MMMLSEVAQAVDGELIAGDVRINSVGIDSRKIVDDQLYVAIKGERFDGHTFAEQALDSGASAVMVSDINGLVGPAVHVADTKLALGKLAAYWRQKIQAPVVAITGSNGKTTTKEMLAAILSVKAESAEYVHATEGNLNNDIGLPLTLLKARAKHQYVIVEMGMNHLGEIAYLTNIAKPTVAVVNNAGTAHIGELGSRENIAKAKGEIFDGLGEQGVAIVNADDQFAAYWMGLNADRKVMRFSMKQDEDVTASYTAQATATALSVKTPQGKFNGTFGFLGEHNAYNALAATSAAVALGVPVNQIATGLANFKGVDGRLQYTQGLNGAVLINDTYNANPDSMQAAIDVLCKQAGETIFVMGDMAELGDAALDMHASIGQYASDAGIKQFYALGQASKGAVEAFSGQAQHFETLALLVAHLQTLMTRHTVMLVKGSRSMQMERVVSQLQSKEEAMLEKQGEKV